MERLGDLKNLENFICGSGLDSVKKACSGNQSAKESLDHFINCVAEVTNTLASIKTEFEDKFAKVGNIITIFRQEFLDEKRRRLSLECKSLRTDIVVNGIPIHPDAERNNRQETTR